MFLHWHLQKLYAIASSLQKHLDYFNHIFWLSELHQRDQKMLIGRFLESPLSNFSLVTLAFLLFQKTYLVTFLHGIFNHSHATKELSISRYARSKKQQKSWFIGFLKGDTNITEVGSFSTTFRSNSKHSLSFVSCTQKECN